jgi:hypothetical protein
MVTTSQEVGVLAYMVLVAPTLTASIFHLETWNEWEYNARGLVAFANFKYLQISGIAEFQSDAEVKLVR